MADVVGLGKSYIGDAAIVKHFERTDHARPLILCPAPLDEMSELYNDAYQLNARALSIGYLHEGANEKGNLLLEDPKFRTATSYLLMKVITFVTPILNAMNSCSFICQLAREKRAFSRPLPATRVAWVVYFQINLFNQDDKTDLPVDPADLKQYFKLIG